MDDYFEWNIVDHLGSTRVKFADKNEDGGILYDTNLPEEDEILGSYHYYPFGMEMDGIWTPDSNPEMQYLYNGKEKVKGLEWYDYGARYYDPKISRFMSVDPLADRGPQYRPYSYCFNNPVKFTDPDGRWPYPSGLWGVYNYLSDKIKLSASASYTRHSVGVSGKLFGYGAGLNVDYGETRNSIEFSLDQNGFEGKVTEDKNPDYGASANYAGGTVDAGVEISEGENPELLDVKFEAQAGPVGVTVSPDQDSHGESTVPVSEVKLEILNIDLGLDHGV